MYVTTLCVLLLTMAVYISINQSIKSHFKSRDAFDVKMLKNTVEFHILNIFF